MPQTSRMANFCTQCGKAAEQGAQFCIHCGTGLRPVAGVAGATRRLPFSTRAILPSLVVASGVAAWLRYQGADESIARLLDFSPDVTLVVAWLLSFVTTHEALIKNEAFRRTADGEFRLER